MEHGTIDQLSGTRPGRGAAGSRARDMRSRRPALLRVLFGAETLSRLVRAATLVALDVAAVTMAIWSALELKAVVRGTSGTADTVAQTLDYAPLACLVTVLLFARSGLYANRQLRPGLSRIVASLFQATVVLLLYAVVEGQDFSSYYTFYGSLVSAVLWVSALRAVFEWVSGRLLRMAGIRRRTVLVGSGSHIEAVAHALEGGPSDLEPVGFVSLTPRPANGLPDFGPLDALEQHFPDIDEVLIADPDFPADQAVELVDRCHEHGIRVRVAPSTMQILADRVEFVPGYSLPLLEVKPPVFEGVDFAVKRTFDVVVSALLLLLLAPVMGLIALLIRTSSKGPVIYRAPRPGIGGVPFACLKFRTMYADAEHRQAELEERNEQSGALFKIRQDPRVTRVGAVLRRFSLDELPQLVNVLRGEMSLVGPRPLPQRDYDRLEEWHRKRYLVLPGITGLWQISGRSELDFDELVRLDFLYLEHWSVFLDLSILLKTVPAVIRGHGAW